MTLSTFERAKRRQQYLPPTARPGCHTCTHLSPLGSGQCLLGGFYTQPFAVCAKREAKPGAAA